MSLEAAALGHGIALESMMLASVHLKRGSLVPVFDRTFAVEVGAHHMVYPSLLPGSIARSAGIRPTDKRCQVWLDLRSGARDNGNFSVLSGSRRHLKILQQ